jgi:hypothetical protein
LAIAQIEPRLDLAALSLIPFWYDPWLIWQLTAAGLFGAWIIVGAISPVSFWFL